jgi:hypothetical protein
VNPGAQKVVVVAFNAQNLAERRPIEQQTAIGVLSAGPEPLRSFDLHAGNRTSR